MKIKYTLLMFLLACLGITTLIKHIKNDYNDYIKSSECIAKHVANKVERSNIAVIGDTCYIKDNQFNK